MSVAEPAPPGVLRTVALLLVNARKRAVQRQKRQSELMQYRTKRKRITNWGRLGFVLAIMAMAVFQGLCAMVVYFAVVAGERIEAEGDNRLLVSYAFVRDLRLAAGFGTDHATLVKMDEVTIKVEAHRIATEHGGTEAVIAAKLRQSILERGTDDLVLEADVAPGIRSLPNEGAFPAMMGSIILLWWGLMLVCQGEGLELDLQRRRHPMWEWLLSHPVSPAAVFAAEMLAPIAANPVYVASPIFAGALYGGVYGFWPGVLAVFVVGIPVAIAAASLGKALEIACILRFSLRTRGAMIGLMSWAGYASLMLLALGSFSARKIAEPIGHFLAPLTALPWPWLGLFLGQAGHVFSFPLGVLVCWCAAGLTVAASVAFSVWAARQGLSGNFGHIDTAPARPKNAGAQFGRQPLYRKELLWFMRDRSAIVQTILIPLTVASVQLFNMRGALSAAQGAWNYLCGAAILFGTYFLWILGPKSLASEGNALWIALTWPRGLESLLKAKAWLWSMVSTGIVALVLLYAIFLFPQDAWKISLVGLGWYFFGFSMAEKTVTLVRVPSSSGEPEKVSRAQQWGASLGMLTFATGTLTQQWNVAIMGIVYSYITAAAMWENFRARLPYLYDAWSEKLPSPPTLMHAMIAISSLVEGAAVITGVTLVGVGRDNIAPYQVIIYGLCAVVVSLVLGSFLYNRGVRLRDVLCWTASAAGPGPQQPWWCGDGTRGGRFFLALFTGVTGGLVLGLFAHLYLAVISRAPSIAPILQHAQHQMANFPSLQISYAVIAIAFAPFTEEFLFRGLLFRALDREWGGWRAILGSAAFFAIYHPVLFWLPVGLLGLTNAFLFKKTGRLAPAVILHMVYNAVVILG